MNSTKRIQKIQEDKAYIKFKKKVLKTFPGAHVRLINGNYEICNSNGFPIRKPELYLPENKTVREAWERAAYSIWFDGMITKSFRAFSDDKMVKKFEQIKEEDTNYAKD